VVVPRGQVDDTVVELIPFPGDQLVSEGLTRGGCGVEQRRRPGSHKLQEPLSLSALQAAWTQLWARPDAATCPTPSSSASGISPAHPG
jgi:hypothetical protein